MGTLPKGQRAIDGFPRFGLQQFQHRFPDQIERVAFEVGGEVGKPLSVEEGFLRLPRTKQVSDLHCVTTWSKCGLEWSGVRFRDFYFSTIRERASITKRERSACRTGSYDRSTDS